MSRQTLPEARRLLGMTQAELGRALGVAGNTIARWERGERRPPGKLLDLALSSLRGEVAPSADQPTDLPGARGSRRGCADSGRSRAPTDRT
jgi:transcriptional regulator with XRE-family HTH domain